MRVISQKELPAATKHELNAMLAVIAAQLPSLGFARAADCALRPVQYSPRAGAARLPAALSRQSRRLVAVTAARRIGASQAGMCLYISTYFAALSRRASSCTSCSALRFSRMMAEPAIPASGETGWRIRQRQGLAWATVRAFRGGRTRPPKFEYPPRC